MFCPSIIVSSSFAISSAGVSYRPSSTNGGMSQDSFFFIGSDICLFFTSYVCVPGLNLISYAQRSKTGGQPVARMLVNFRNHLYYQKINCPDNYCQPSSPINNSTSIIQRRPTIYARSNVIDRLHLLTLKNFRAWCDSFIMAES